MGKGVLYVVSTPIGNMKDITYRAVEILKSSDIVYAESIKRSRTLFSFYDIKVPIKRYYEKNKEKVTPYILEELKDGKRVSLISDAGTPSVSDPGFFLIREALKENLDVVPVPGVSAFLTALVCSGLPTDKFVFYGFLPRKTGKRKKIIEEILNSKYTTILYESPYRIIKLLEEIASIDSNRYLVVARELTKMYETFYRGTPIELMEKIRNNIKGEFVVVIGGSTYG